VIGIAAPLTTVDELMIVLRGKFSVDQQEGLQQCIDAATQEVASEVDPLSGVLGKVPTPEGERDWDVYEKALANRVCLARAVEWWKANDALFGIIGSAEIGALRAPRDGFARHARALGPLKEQWGFA
jgi:hypothetical protein